jgi:hypothetical protein
MKWDKFVNADGGHVEVCYVPSAVCTLKSEYSSGHQSVLYLVFIIFLYILIILDFVILESVTPVMMGR